MITRTYEFFARFDEWNTTSLLCSLTVFAFMTVLMITKNVTKSKNIFLFLGPLISAVFGTIIVRVFGFDDKYGVILVGGMEENIPSGLEFTNPFANF